MLAKSPGFTLVVVGLLAVGIGATTLIFSAFDTVLLRPLPVRHAEELVRMVQKLPKVPTTNSLPAAYYQTLRNYSTTLSAVFGEAQLDVAMNEPGPSEAIQVYLPTPEYFDVLGVHALYGRTLVTDDAKDEPGTPPAVLSYGFWRRRFGGDPHVIGTSLVLRGNRFVIVGVLPREFNGISADTAPDVRVPLRTLPLLWILPAGLRMDRVQFELAGRLKPGISRAQAETECQALWRSAVGTYYPGELADFEFKLGMALDPIQHGFSLLGDRYGTTLKFLSICVGLLLLMISANLAGLLLARGATRREEMGLRLAIGATRARLVRQMLTESLLLMALGALGGVLVAIFLAPVLTRALPPIRDLGTRRLPISLDLGLNHRVLFFSLTSSALTAMLFGLGPAIAASRTSLDSVLRGIHATRLWRGRKVLVAFQVAVCTLLLVISGLLAETLEHLYDVNPGFDRDHVVTITADPSLSGSTREPVSVRLQALLDRVGQLPGVVSAGLSLRGVMRAYGIGMTVGPAGQPISPTDFLNTSANVVSPGYFETMGMRMIAGRNFRSDEDATSKPVRTVVNQAFVDRFFPNIDPVGRLFGENSPGEVAGASHVILGVVTNAKYRSLREPMSPIVYTSAGTNFPFGFVLNVRTRGNPESMIQPIRQALSAIDPALPLLEVDTVSEEVKQSMAGERLAASLATIFGVLAAFLAAVGIYGLLAYLVTLREREVGIRVALGARRLDIGLLIGKQALAMIVGGLVLGLGATAVVAPWTSSILYGVAPWSSRSFFGATALVLAVAVFGTAIPFVRATRIEAAAALRQQN
jgi:putative ABC transport system permease protein